MTSEYRFDLQEVAESRKKSQELFITVVAYGTPMAIGPLPSSGEGRQQRFEFNIRIEQKHFKNLP
jgi:hypothetical protein